MTSNIFLDWLTNLDKRFCKEKKRIAMIVDNCPAHPDVQGLKAIKLIFLPPNATSKLQPCDQGIIQCLKTWYRKFLVQNYLGEIGNGEKKRY